MRRPRTATTRLTMLLAALLVCACDGATAAHTFEVIDDNGVQVAINSGIPKYEGELFVYDRILEIRANPEVTESMLYDPRSFMLGDDGLYYVADTNNHRVAVFDADGAFVRAIGRAGEGPGELQAPRSVQVSDGVLTVFARRTSRFATDGTFIDVLAVPESPVYRSSEGHLISIDYPQGAEDDGYYYVGTSIDVRWPDGTDLATVESPRVRWARVTEGGQRADLHYAGTPSFALAPTDELLLSTGLEPVVSWYDLAGSLRRQMRIDLGREAVTEADRARVAEHFDRLIATAQTVDDTGLVARIERMKEEMELAEVKAPWTMVTVEASGWLWLQLPAPRGGVYRVGTPAILAPQSYRIVDPRGEYIGITNWPPEARPFGTSVERGHLLAMIPDPVTEETIPTVYAIRSAISDLEYPGSADVRER